MPQRLLLALILASMLVLPASAQGVRSLGMGGVTTTGGAESVNPAYGSFPSQGFALPLPLGAVSYLTNPKVDPTKDTVDYTTVIDQATRLGSYLINPAVSPDQINIAIDETAAGDPTIAITTSGGSPLLLTTGQSLSLDERLSLPIAFDVRDFRVGVRPYADVSAGYTPDANLKALFGDGATGGKATIEAQAEAGVALEVGYSTLVPVETYDGDVYVGVRVSPFVGLAKVDGSASAELTTAGSEIAYSANGDAFAALVSNGGLGYGVRLDLGVATVMPMETGDLTVGLSARNLNYAIWNGQSYDVAFTQNSDSLTGEGTTASRTYIADELGFVLTAQYDIDTEAVSVGEVDSWFVAGDVQYDIDGAFSGRVGTEAGFDVDFGTVFARAGGGYDDGLVLGLGSGVQFGGWGVDLAVNGRRAAFTSHTSFGIATGLNFGF
jgi:hypothetical protein